MVKYVLTGWIGNDWEENGKTHDQCICIHSSQADQKDHSPGWDFQKTLTSISSWNCGHFMWYVWKRMFLQHGLKNDKITLQTVVTLGIASQSWSRTKSGGQTYTFQFTGTDRHAFSLKGIGLGRGTDNVEFLTNWRPTGGAYRFPVNLFWQILWFVLSTARCSKRTSFLSRIQSIRPPTYSFWMCCGATSICDFLLRVIDLPKSDVKDLEILAINQNSVHACHIHLENN